MSPTDTAYADAVRFAAEAALNEYDLPTPVSVEPIRLLNNAVFAVTAGDRSRYALRVHRPRYRLAEHTRSELVFLDSVQQPLTDAGVRVPVPVRAERRIVAGLRSPCLDSTLPHRKRCTATC